MNLQQSWSQLTDKQKAEFLRERLNLLTTYLQKTDRWYTGTSIKIFLKKNIFQLQSSENLIIKTGRWSAYCHYSIQESLNNLLDKSTIDIESKILVHPLLPSELLAILKKKKVQLLTLDIEKDTLAWDLQKLEKFLSTQKIDLVINFSFNGLYKPLIEQVEIFKAKIIPQIIIIDKPFITTKLLELFSKQVLGSILWNFGDSFWDQELNLWLTEKLTIKNWYLSWHFENRTSSILEYHLSKSQKKYELIVKNYYRLILEKYRKFNWLQSLFYTLFAMFALEINFLEKQNTEQEILNFYKQTVAFALPDLIFDLQILNQNLLQKFLPVKKIEDQNNLKTSFKSKINTKIKYTQTENSTNSKKNLDKQIFLNYLKIDQEIYLQKQAEKYYQEFTKQVDLRPKGSIEIPRFFLDQVYLDYFFYSTEIAYWQKIYPSLKRITVDPWFLQQNLPNLNFIHKYGLTLKVS